ncbi:hypothetical protein GGI43DRAFT_389514 [Trichoderma evansii]
METSSVTVAADLSAKIIILCSQYIVGVANARAEIERLKEQLKNLETTLRRANHLLEQPNSQFLSASRELNDPLQRCQAELQRLQDKLEPSAAQKAMRRFGLRAAKWPFRKGDVEAIIASLVDYREAITAILQIDQTKLLLNINERIENLSLQPGGNTSVNCKPHFIVPFPRDPDFVDRPALRQWLEEQYNASLARRIALVGMGGFGKSQIAIEFAHRVHITSPENSVFWVHGGTEARFEESYRSLANTLALPDRNDPNVNVLALVRDWLQKAEAQPWLMILDNADEMETLFPNSENKDNQREPLASYLPKTGNGKIVITSRNRSVAEKLTGSHKAIREVPTMDSLETLKILENKLSRDVDRDAAIDLARALDFIPLAVNQAAAYINRHAPRVSIRAYLDEFQQNEEQKKSLLNRDAGDLRRREDVSNSVVITWQVTFEQIRQERPTAANLLLLMSFFQPQNIPRFMLSGYNIVASIEDVNSDSYENIEVNLGEDLGEDLEDDLDVLQSYSFIRLSTTSGLYDMHALVQFCTKVWLLESSEDNYARLKYLFWGLGAEHFPSGEFGTWARCRLLLPHMKSCLDEEPTNDLDVIEWSGLLAKVSWYMLQIGDYFAAESITLKILDSRKKLLGDDENLYTMKIMAILSAAYFSQGRVDEAELLLLKVIRASTKLCGDEHPKTMGYMSTLVNIHRVQGRFGDAELLGVRVVETSKKIWGDEHLTTLSNMSNLANTYREQGRYAEAELLGVQVMETSKKILGDEHPETLDSLFFLASTYKKQQRLAEAESLFLQVTQTRKKILGDEHPRVLRDMFNLCLIFQEQGRLREAELLAKHVIETRKRILGDEHPDVLEAMNDLADMMREQERLTEAESLYVEVIETRKKVLGDEHPDVFDSMIDLAIVFQQQGRLDDALKLLRDTVSRMQRILGPEHKVTLFGSKILRKLEQEQA